MYKVAKVAVVSLMFLAAGCVNPYAKFYQDRTGGIDVTTNPHVVPYYGKPKLLQGNNPNEDFQRMLEDGYAPLGFSSFNGTNRNSDTADNAVSYGEDIHAEIVIFYSQYTGTLSGVMPMTLPNNHTSTTTMSGNAYGSGGFATFNGTANTTTYGTQTTYMPYSVPRFNYLATYWVKHKPSILGLLVNDLNDEQREQLNSNKGIAVLTVIKDSPAYRADFFKGDILRKIGDIDLYDVKSFQSALQKYEGQKVNIIFMRDGKEIEKEIQLNSKPE